MEKLKSCFYIKVEVLLEKEANKRDSNAKETPPPFKKELVQRTMLVNTNQEERFFYNSEGRLKWYLLWI